MRTKSFIMGMILTVSIVVALGAQGSTLAEWEITSGDGHRKNEVTIPDPKLQEVLRKALGLTAEEPITDAALAGMTYLSASWKLSIHDLTGLEYCTNLTSLELDYNSISDVTPLQRLTKLRDLNLDGNNIMDIGPLQGLINLERLMLKENQVYTAAPLQGLKYLRSLSLDSNQISDVTPLQGLTNLAYLGLNGGQISNNAFS